MPTVAVLQQTRHDVPVPSDDALLDLARAVVGVSTRAAGRLGGISVTQLRALTVLGSLDGGNLVALAEQLGIAVSTASRLVDRLVTAGLADRQPAPHTRREVVLRPTEAGRSRLACYDDLRLAELRAALDALPAGRRADVLSALTEFATALAGDGAEAERRRPAEPEGGDPACWLQRVCPACGRMAEEDLPTRCAACGEPLPAE
jgi:DNA-binding MarR family transcriptional regulator